MEIKNTNHIKAIAFDLGRVLFDFDYNIALDKIKDKINIAPDRIIHALFHENLTDDFEKGIITGRDFYLKFKEKTGLRLSYDEFVPIWCDIFSIKEESIELVKSLRSLYRVLLISNINQLHYDFLKERYWQVFSLFEDKILSFEVKELKPSKKIYEILLAKAKSTKDELIYIDDRPDLITEAKEQGLKCIEFKDVKQCKRELKGFGCQVLFS
jgi:FMN phosphatase YigB (HAD superfamily)